MSPSAEAIKATVREVDLGPFVACRVWVDPEDFVELAAEWFGEMRVRDPHEQPWIPTKQGIAILEVRSALPSRWEIDVAVEAQLFEPRQAQRVISRDEMSAWGWP